MASENDWDVAIVGGGLAGGIAAFHCARSGLRTVLFEKEKKAHQKVCGEFLSGESFPILEETGIDLAKLGAVTLGGFRFHGPHRTVASRLPLAAAGISRYILDDELLRRAEGAGAEIRRGVKVKKKLDGLEGPAGAIVLETSEGLVAAKRLIVATGKSEFSSVENRVGRDSGLVGFKMHVQLKPSMKRDLADNCDLFVFEGGYGGLAPIEGGIANFCFLIEKMAVRSIGSDWVSLASYISRHNWEASRLLDGAEPLFKSFCTVANVPYGYLRATTPDLGVYCVGDQMAVIPSLTGNGMTIAVSTGLLAAQAIIDPRARGQMRPASTSIVYQRRARTLLRSQVNAGFHLHRLFKNPAICDWATVAANAFPKILDNLFTRTRCTVAGRVLEGRARGSISGEA